MSSPEAVVREFCAAVTRRDVELLRPLLADEVRYLNVGMPATIGIDDVLANVAGQWQMFPDFYEFEVLHLAATGEVVLTERLDVIGSNEMKLPIPVMGTFEVRNGKITEWRDYFDSALIGKLMAGEDVSQLVP